MPCDVAMKYPDPALKGRVLTCAGVALGLWPLLKYSGFEPALLFEPGNQRVIGGFLAGFFPLATDGFFLGLLWQALLQTLAIANTGLALALIIACPLALLSCEALSLQRIGPPVFSAWRSAVRPGVRGVTLFLRGIPDVVWALLFVRVFGLGPAAAVLALGLTYGGMLGKVFSEILDSADRAPSQAILLAGGSRLAAFAYGLLPQAAGEILSYAVYRWECALRAAVVMGLVGAGGLGQLLDQSIKAFNGSEVASILMAFLALVLLADLISAVLRKWLDLQPASRFLARFSSFCGRSFVLLAFGLLAISWQSLALEPGLLISWQSLQDMRRFIAEFFPPTLDLKLWIQIAHGALETFAISLLATLLAALLAASLAMFAAGRMGWLGRVASRGVLNFLRSVPELVWAALTVLAAGLGPFAGVLALALHTAGVLGRLYAETLENVSPLAEEALLGSGASRVQAFIYGSLPQVAPQGLAYALYRWEINIRMAAVMGFVGAGGLGQMLYLELSLFRLGNACSVILAMLGLALLVDWLSATSRRWSEG